MGRGRTTGEPLRWGTPPQATPNLRSHVSRSAAGLGHSQFAAVFTTFAIMAFGLSVIGPVLSTIRAEFDISFASLGLIAGMQALGRGLTTVPVGYLADRYRPRALISVGSLLVGLGSLVSAFAPVFGALVVGSLISGAGTAFVFMVGMTYIVRSSSPRERGRMVGRTMAGFGLGSLLAPLVAGVLANALGWRSIFVLAAALSVVAVGIAWTISGAAQPTRPSSGGVRLRLPGIGSTRNVLAVVAVSALTWGTMGSLSRIVLPLYGTEGLQLDPARAGLWLSLFAAATAVVMLASGTLIDRAGRTPALLAGTLVAAAASVVMLFPVELGLYVVLGLASATVGFTAPLIPLLVADRSPPAQVGQFMGIVQFMTDGVILAMPPLLGTLLDLSGFGAVGLFFVAALAAAAVVGVRVIRATVETPHHAEVVAVADPIPLVPPPESPRQKP